MIAYSRNTFNFEPLFAIPAISHPPGIELSTSFVYVKSYLLRVESICFHDVEPLLWKPHVTVWLLPKQHDFKEKFSGEFRRHGEGQYFDDWISKSTCVTEGSIDGISFGTIGIDGEEKSLHNSASRSNNLEKFVKSLHNSASRSNNLEKFVSSSMVIFEDCYPPLALVYGFCDGDIQVVWFDIYFDVLRFHSQNRHYKANSYGSKRYLSGQKGAVLCLAAHRMVSTHKKGNFSHVLVSGSMDCTVRIWDLDSSNPIIVMHQHVAPVRQIILLPPHTKCPWSDCFLSVAEDRCVALASLGTLQVLRGAAAHSMLDHFCMGMKKDTAPGNLMTRNTSAFSLTNLMTEGNTYLHSHLKYSANGASKSSSFPVSTSVTESNRSQTNATKDTVIESIESTMSSFESDKAPIEASCPFPGITTLCFDLKLVMSLCKIHEFSTDGSVDHRKTPSVVVGVDTIKDIPREKEDNQQKDQETEIPSSHQVSKESDWDMHWTSAVTMADYDWLRSPEGCLLLFGLSLLHLWNVDYELDKLLETEMNLKGPEDISVASGLIGDRGSWTRTFPGASATLELLKLSSEFCALRSLTMVSLAQQIISLSPLFAGASSALAAFYTRNFAEKIPDIKPPLLQLLVSFWQGEFEHAKMAARSLFLWAASRAVLRPLFCKKENSLGSSNGLTKVEYENRISKNKINFLNPYHQPETQGNSQTEESEILSWLESFDTQDWISSVGGTSQDAMTSHIVVSAALAVWYPSLVKPNSCHFDCSIIDEIGYGYE